jgi:hypothetical protein
VANGQTPVARLSSAEVGEDDGAGTQKMHTEDETELLMFRNSVRGLYSQARIQKDLLAYRLPLPAQLASVVVSFCRVPTHSGNRAHDTANYRARSITGHD